jgi:hypothetical protein
MNHYRLLLLVLAIYLLIIQAIYHLIIRAIYQVLAFQVHSGAVQTFTYLQDPETREAARKALAGKAGIYCIRSLKDGKCYVGSAVNL